MELLTITLAANETKQFAKAGRYLEITDSSYAVRVDFIGDQGQQTDSMVNALSGLFIEDPFAAFAITNGATAQSVTFLILEMGRGGSRRQPGIVSVTNKISQAVTQFELNGGGPAADVIFSDGRGCSCSESEGATGAEGSGECNSGGGRDKRSADDCRARSAGVECPDKWLQHGANLRRGGGARD